MNDSTEKLIQELMETHGVAIDRNDPILILHTLNERLRDENIKTQALMLNQYKEELEAIALRWGNEAREKSERILNASLTASKQLMTQLGQDNAQAIALSTKKEIDDSLSHVSQVLQRTERAALFNLLASAITLLAGSVIVFGLFLK